MARQGFSLVMDDAETEYTQEQLNPEHHQSGHSYRFVAALFGLLGLVSTIAVFYQMKSKGTSTIDPSMSFQPNAPEKLFAVEACPACFKQAPNAASFTMAEVKPHFQCRDPNGRDAVRQYVSELVLNGTGIISLIEFEFSFEKPEGYFVFGGSCKKKFEDPVVAFVREEEFSLVKGLGNTLVGDYKDMPFLAGDDAKASVGDMCISDPDAKICADSGDACNFTRPVGLRPYAGVILKHILSGHEICVVVATFPHCLFPWGEQFKTDVKECDNRQLVIVADTNAGCELNGPEDSKHYSMGEIAAANAAGWGACQDRGTEGPPTCCNDTKKFGHPDPTLWYDRTATCRGGFVDEFEVQNQYYCNVDEEHRFTTARVYLADGKSAYCNDHPVCSDLKNTVGGLCCPNSFGQNLTCCAP